MAALIALGVLMLPWRFSVYAVAFLTIAWGFGPAMIFVAVFGWYMFISRSIRYA